MKWRKNPFIYEINTRVWLKEISDFYGMPLTLGELPDECFIKIKSAGFDAVWLMGVWEPSPAGREIAKNHEGLKNEFLKALPDLVDEDIVASPYAVKNYSVSETLGGESALKLFREKAAEHGLLLILDFVPNHTALDCPWIKESPEFYVQGTYSDYVRDSSTFFNAGTESEPLIVAHGKDPYFPGWTDTAQLNYYNAALRQAMIEVILRIASMCDGIRCDMAMLAMNGIHYQVWGDRLFAGKNFQYLREEFWSQAISRTKALFPDFIFIAEAYWMQEGPLQELGFDYTYDKPLYDWLKHGDVKAISSYLREGLDLYQSRCLRFIENHDEERAAAAFGIEHHKSSMLAAATLPGSKLIYEGQLEGRKVKIPVQLGRRPYEAPDNDLSSFYKRLMSILSSEAFHIGDWKLYNSRSAWEGNYTYSNFLIWSWSFEEYFYLTVINFSPFRSQCYVPLPQDVTDGKNCFIVDMLGEGAYERDGCVLCRQGFYLDMPPWSRHLFNFEFEVQNIDI